MKKSIKVGIIGLGTVGSKVIEILRDNKPIIEQKVGVPVELLYACDNRRKKIKALENSKAIFTLDWNRVVSDPRIDIIVELIGSSRVAEQVVFQSLKNNKNIVTANKALLADKWNEIFSLAQDRKKLVYFEAAVGAGIPVIQALNEGLAGNKIRSIVGILNGTTNYILTKMFKENVSFDTALQGAQKNGFAEANPTMDITGKDTLSKLSILSSIAWSSWIKPENIYCEGINNLSPVDIKFAYDEFDYIMKLLGFARNVNGKIEVFVRPCLIPKAHPFASVENEYNSILIEGDSSGEIIFYGKGAGGGPAASAVVSDIIFLARQVAANTAGLVPDVNINSNKAGGILPLEESTGNFYLRFNVADKSGVLSKISGTLSKHGVSISSVVQKEPVFNRKSGTPIVVVTHATREGSLRKAIKEIDRLAVVKEKTILVRIIDL